MKHELIITLTLITYTSICDAQTNTFPTSGNVGIGTNSPVSTLHLQETGAELTLKADTHNSEYSGAIVFDEGDGSKHFRIVYDGLNGNGGGRLLFKSLAHGDVVSILRNGNFGIGTSSPVSKIHIHGDGSEPTLKADTHNSQYSGAIVFDEGDGSKHFRIVYDGLNGNGGGRLLFNSLSHGDVLTINRDGNVGIGTTLPNHELSVDGTIQAKEVIVETGWSDFVFDDGYDLKTLGEVETHIEEYGHLPDVPPAAVVESEGLSVGEAQTIMMQKIEELTLYMIEKDKQVAALQEQVRAQQLRIQALEKN